MTKRRHEETTLGHERFDAYQYAVRFLAKAVNIQRAVPRGHGELIDQLRRASLSIPLNIAEGSGRTSRAERRRFYTIARGSSLECGAILDACGVLGVIDTATIRAAKQLLVHIVRILSTQCL
jgi:four helix bundle protein